MRLDCTIPIKPTRNVEISCVSFVSILRELELFAQEPVEKKITLYSLISAFFSYKNRLTSGCKKQETRAPAGNTCSLLRNLLIMIVTDTHAVSFAKRPAYRLTENWDKTCHFSWKQLSF